MRRSFQKCMNFVTFCLKFHRDSPGLLGYSTKSVPCMTVLSSTYGRLIPCNSPSCNCLLPPSGMSPSSFRSLCSWLLCTFSYVLSLSHTLPLLFCWACTYLSPIKCLVFTSPTIALLLLHRIYLSPHLYILGDQRPCLPHPPCEFLT